MPTLLQTSPSPRSRPCHGWRLLLLVLYSALTHAELPVPCSACKGTIPWVTAGAATHQTVGNALNVHQTSRAVTLNWESFNIGAGNEVNFRQPDASALALNRIHQGDPSKIFGALNANGQVYLINQNGIVFGAGARVNVGALLASTLDLTEQAIASGITQAINSGQPAFRAFTDANGNLASGDIAIAAGAELRAAAGGSVLVFAPRIRNDGSISTPDGQTILAAGEKVYLMASADFTLRGLLVEVDVDTVDDPALRDYLRGVTAGLTSGEVTNTGTIATGQGNVTLMGLAVNQRGRVSATTSAVRNGSIRLLARDQATVQSGFGLSNADGTQVSSPGVAFPARGGQVTVGAGSTTEITLDPSDETGAPYEIDTSLKAGKRTRINTQPKSEVTLTGHTVELESRSAIRAKGGTVTVVAQANPSATIIPDTRNTSRFVAHAGSVIDVSGADATLPTSRNSVTLELRGNELKDSPVQRNGPLRGKRVVVDVRVKGTRGDGRAFEGTPLADASGALDAVPRGVEERNATGGTVSIRSQGDIVFNPGSVLNLSGGSVRYQDGPVTSTKLVSQGRIFDISNADPNRVYDGIFGFLDVEHPKWGPTDSYLAFGQTGFTAFAAGYTEGADAGHASFVAPFVVLNGDILAEIRRGRYQLDAADELRVTSTGSEVRPFNQMPRGATLTLGDTEGSLGGQFPDYRLVDVEFTAARDGAALGTFDEQISNRSVRLATDLFGPGRVQHLEVASRGSVSLPAGIDLDLGVGSLAITGNTLDLGGTVDAIGGDIGLHAELTVVDTEHASLQLRETARLTTAGAWRNEVLDRQFGIPFGERLPDAGVIALSAESGRLTVAAGAVLNLNGGGWRDVAGRLHEGHGGDLRLNSTPTALGAPGFLDFAGTVSSFAFASGGEFSASAFAVCIGPCSAAEPAALRLAPGFFSSNGFASYDLSSNVRGVTLQDGVTITPRQSNILPSQSLSTLPSARKLESFESGLLADWERAPTNLSLTTHARRESATEVVAAADFPSLGILALGAGSRILLDPGAHVDLRSNTRLALAGEISAPGGEITAVVDNSLPMTEFIAAQSVWLTAGAKLDVSATFVPRPDPQRLRTGRVFDGGLVNLEAMRGFVIAERGALLDVGGEALTLDLRKGVSGSLLPTIVPRLVAAKAGRIEIVSAEGGLLAATFDARGAAAPGAAAGSLEYRVDVLNRLDDPQTPFFPQSSRIIELGANPTDPLEGARPGDALPTALVGRTVVDVGALTSGGFANLHFEAPSVLSGSNFGRITLAPGTALQARRAIELDTPEISAGPGSTISASYVALGSTTRATQEIPAALAGTGTLDVRADFIDLVGSFTFQNAARLGLHANSDIRMRGIQVTGGRKLAGALQTQAHVTLQADQIYPATLADYTLTSTGGASSGISILPGDSAPAPVLSAAGALTFIAPVITQAGTLRAPFGALRLDADTLTLADGSVTSTTGSGLTVPFGQTQGGLEWSYPLRENQTLVFNNVLNTLPGQSLVFEGRDLVVSSSAQIDLRGGGTLLAYEFLPGPGGSSDILLATESPQSFAILPFLPQGFGAFDPLEYDGVTLRPGDQLELAGSDLLPAGTYTLFPARYALLPGAVLATRRDGYTDILPQETATLADGSILTAGRRAVLGTPAIDSRTEGYALLAARGVRTLAEYSITEADDFFPAHAARTETPVPALPRDAGALQFNLARSLNLAGSVRADAPTGRAPRVDLRGDRVFVAGSGGAAAPAGFLSAQASQLASLAPESLLIGALRQTTSAGFALTNVAETLVIADGASLVFPELLLAASDALTLEANSVVASTARIDAAAAPLEYSVVGDGTLLRVANTRRPVALVRTGENPVPANRTGVLDIRAGATVAATGALLLDASRDTLLAGQLETAGANVSLNASEINLGDPGGAVSGLLLRGSQLAELNANSLSLVSRSAFNFFANASLFSKDLTLRARTFRGQAAGTAEVGADTLRILGQDAAVAVGTDVAEISNLQLNSRLLSLGDGTSLFDGFANVTVTTHEALSIDGAGAASFNGDLRIETPAIVGQGGANFALAAAGDLTVAARATAAPAPSAGLGARLAFSGRSVAFAPPAASAPPLRVFAPSGTLRLTATGNAGEDLAIGPGTLLDVAGVARAFRDGISVPTPGGRILLSAASGDVVIDDATLALDGNGVEQGGEFAVTAASGAFSFSGTLTADGATAGMGGVFSIDVRDLPSLSALSTLAGAAGADRGFRVRARQGDLTLSGAVTARDISITADGGDLTIAGVLDASGPKAGRIFLGAADRLELTTSARVFARGEDASAEGGVVTLSAAAAAAIGAAAGEIVVAGDSQIDVTGDAQGGQVLFRLPRAAMETLANANPDRLVLPTGVVTGARAVTFEGYEAFNDTSISGSEFATAGNPRFNALQNFANNSAAILQTLSLTGVTGASVRPGLEIRSSSDLALGLTSGTAGWDLLSWRFNGLPGQLTLRAAGNLDINQTLSDGIVRTGTGSGARDTPQPGESWTYRLVAGADLTSADPMATLSTTQLASGKGSLSVLGGTASTGAIPSMPVLRAIRTGTGDIQIATGRDLTLTNRASVIYTAGAPVTAGSVAINIQQSLGGRLYPDNGGNIEIRAGGNINGAITNQLVTEWQYRSGNPGDGIALFAAATAWTPALERFEQNVGTLGGGHIEILAGGNINNLSAVVPTVGRQIGGTRPPDSIVEIIGGGDLRVSAGGNLLSGVYHVGRGSARLEAGGSVASGRTVSAFSTAPLHTLLLLGDGSFDVWAGDGLAIESVMNPTAVTQSRSQNVISAKAFYFTYAQDSRVALNALSGTLALNNNDDGIQKAMAPIVPNFAEVVALTTYAPNLIGAALEGSISVSGSMRLFPAPKGNLTLLAATDIDLFSANVLVSDADAALLGTVQSPRGVFPRDSLLIRGVPAAIHAAVPVHSLASQPDGLPDLQPVRLQARDGAVRFVRDEIRNEFALLSAPKAVDISAGGDIIEPWVIVQHSNGVPGLLPDSEVSVLRAGGDIRYQQARNASGLVLPTQSGLFVDGPGELVLYAGGTIDFQTSTGIETRGNQVNPALPDTGTTVALYAGLGDTQPDFAGFHRFLRERGELSLLTRFDVNGRALSTAEASSLLDDFGEKQYEPYLRRAYLLRLREAGRLAARGDTSFFEAGYAAERALFSAPVYDGDINLVFSKINTLDGGDIHLLVPGGLINAGLANPPQGLDKGPEDLGIVVQSIGNLFTYSSSDVLINQSRAFVGDGGDLMMWSSLGNIDAGRGAKTSISAPPPTFTVGANGSVQVTFPAALTGSGIRAFVTTPGRSPGTVDLFAPNGVVDAGDAGIGSAGDINIAATAVLGADNISVGGAATGVPTTSVSVPVGLAGASAAANSATRAATSDASEGAAASDGDAISKSITDSLVSLVSVQFIGFGE